MIQDIAHVFCNENVNKITDTSIKSILLHEHEHSKANPLLMSFAIPSHVAVILPKVVN